MQCDEVLVPIPSHFSRHMFTIATLGNFDHQDRSSPTGMTSTHETVSTLSKPMRNSVSLKAVSDSTSLVLPCQKMLLFKGIKKQIVLESNFTVEDELLQNTGVQKERDMKVCYKLYQEWNPFSSYRGKIPTWAGCEALIFDYFMLKMHTGFLPYILHPVTEFSTVYMVLKNALSQLVQTLLPVFYDDRVYRIAADVTQQKKDEYSGIMPLLVRYHWIICAAKSEVIETLKNLFGTFVCKVVHNSEIRKYWEAVLKIIHFMKDLIAANWTGNWDVHLQTEQHLIPLFREIYSINYLRYVSLYLEKVR